MSDRIGVMNAGQLQQVATPREIYTTPRNRFVASFIGETNFLPVTPAAPGSVRLGSGEIVAAEGEGPILSIRPEQVRIVTQEAPGSVTATLDSLVYLGTEMLCHFRLGDGEPITARLSLPPNGETGLYSGDRVGLVFERGAARLIQD